MTDTASMPSRFDYIVCGAGTSGCVVAARLAADPAKRVLLLEAGGSDDVALVMNPNLWPLTLGGALDWGFVAEPNPNLLGRALPYGMGKVLGGGSSINVATWSRGHRADWDYYAEQSGEATWSYHSVLALYRNRIEDWVGDADPQYRGVGGKVHVQPAANPSDFATALLEATQLAAGLSRFSNPNGRMMEAAGGCAFIDETVHHGARRSIFRSYIEPLWTQPNLTVLTGALVSRILFEGRRATGVQFIHEGRTLDVAAAHEVILSLGAIHTPKLLMQSGIGDPEELTRVGVPVRHALPGVGRNLHDHVLLPCLWELTTKTEMFGVPRSQTTSFWQTDAALDSPNFYAYSVQRPIASPEILARFKPAAETWSLLVGMRPHSRGCIHLTGPDIDDPVRIDANYLDDPRDLRDLLAGLQVARAVGNSTALRAFSGRELAPGLLGRSELERFVRESLSTYWHQSGTAKLGRDAMSVVDGKLRVHGLEQLRIADAAILPRVTTGNTMAPCVVIGELAASYLSTGR
jgi:choline dehydrogenase